MNRIDGKMLRRVVQAIGTVLDGTMNAKGAGFFNLCDEVLCGSTVARRWWKNLEPREQLSLFKEARKRVLQELGGIKNRKRRSAAR